MRKTFAAKLPGRQAIIAISVILAVAVIVVLGFLNEKKQQADMAPKRESAYANVLKDSLSVYYARYQKYPESYPALLGDMQKTPEIYGVSGEGMAEMADIGGELGEFSYTAKSGGKGYEFTYKKSSGSTITVKSE